MVTRFEGLAKAATIFAVIFGVSLGLCGATFVLSTSGGRDRVVIPLASLEVLGMLAGLLGLIVTGLTALFQKVFSQKDES